MATIAVNDTIPEGTFKYVPYSDDLEKPGVSTASSCTVTSILIRPCSSHAESVSIDNL